MVYIIEAIGRGYYKIGHGIVDNRLCALQTGCPDELKVAMTGEGGMILEKRLHTKFHHRLIRGEWFALTTEDLAEIKEILANSTVEQDGIDIEERTVKVQQIVINKKPSAVSQEVWSKIKESGQIFI